MKNMIAPIIGLTGVAIASIGVVVLVGHALLNSNMSTIERMCFGGILIGFFMYGVARAIDFARGIK